MVLVLVIALLGLLVTARAVDSKKFCEEYCLSLPFDETSSNKCDCSNYLPELHEAMTTTWPTPVSVNDENPGIFYLPAKTINGPRLSLLSQPFFILNPAFKISFEPPEPKRESMKRTPDDEQFKQSNDDYRVSSINNGDTKVPIYLDIVVPDSSESERAASPQASWYSNPLKESALSDCIDLHILAYSRDINNTTAISQMSSKSLDLYGSLSDAEIREEIDRKCSHAIELVNDSIQEIQNTRPKKKYDTSEQDSVSMDSGETTKNSIETWDSARVENTLRDMYSTEQPKSVVDYGEDLQNETMRGVYEDVSLLPNSPPTTTSTEATTYGTEFTDSTASFTENAPLEVVPPEEFNTDSNVTNITVIPRARTANDDINKYVGNQLIYDNTDTTLHNNRSFSDSDPIVDLSNDQEDLRRPQSSERGNNDDYKDVISSNTILQTKLPAPEDFTNNEPLDYAADTKWNIINVLVENDTDHRMVNQPISVQKIVTIELPNSTVISDAKGTETESLLHNIFDDNFGNSDVAIAANETLSGDSSQVNKQSEANEVPIENTASEITGALYFNFNKAYIPAHFVQSPDGKINVGINGTSFCDKLLRDADKEYVLFSKLCNCVRFNRCN